MFKESFNVFAVFNDFDIVNPGGTKIVRVLSLGVLGADSLSAGADSCLINTSVDRVPGTETVDGDSEFVVIDVVLSDLETEGRSMGSDFEIVLRAAGGPKELLKYCTMLNCSLWYVCTALLLWLLRLTTALSENLLARNDLKYFCQ